MANPFATDAARLPLSGDVGIGTLRKRSGKDLQKMNEFDDINGKCERFVKDVEGVRDLVETLLTVWPELYKGGQALAGAAERIKPVNYALTANGAEIMSGLRELYPELQEALKTLGVIKASAQLIQKTADGMRERRPAMPKVYEKPVMTVYKEGERE